MIDVLVIGSGGAGLTAAINAKENNSKVLVVSKTQATYSQTVQAQGGINAVLYEDNDSITNHIEDTYKSSYKLSIKDNIKYLCKEAKNTIKWLDSIGVPFNRDTKNNFSQRKFGGTKNIRTCYSSDYTGLKIIHTLFDQCIKNDIDFLCEHFLLDLIIENNICKGGIFFDIVSGEIKEILSKTTIIATGGYAGIYKNNTTNSYSNCGDGVAVALRAGAKLYNMEFIQFHPTALLDTNILISESARGEGGYIVDQNENRFIDELKSRDEVTNAIYIKIQNGNKVFLDLRHIGLDKIKELLPQEQNLAFYFSNIKIESELLPIIPAAHYSMGGIKIDLNTKTNIDNLYACGECAQASIHGANRLGGNSLLEIITFGKLAGLNASKKAKEIISLNTNHIQLNTNINLINNIYNYPNKINFYENKEFFSNEIFSKLGIFKTEESINDFIKTIDEISSNLTQMGIGDKSKYYNTNLVEFIEFTNMLEISKVIALCAKNRKESRGSHNRLDYKESFESFEKFSFSYLKDAKLEIGFEDIQ